MRLAVFFVAAFLLRSEPPSNPVFATYLGGGGSEVAGSVAIDAQGNIYVAGRTDSPDFPVKNAIQPLSKAFSQIFIAKFSPAGELLFSTYLGGTSNDLATGIALDPAGNIYVTGALQSHDFPVANAFQTTSGGAVDAFVLKLDPAFQVIYATYVGGKFNDVGMAIAADAQGNAYVTGRTESPDFPITSGAYAQTIAGYQPGYTSIDAFVTKLDASGKLVYSTYVGGSGSLSNIGYGIAVDNFGQAHVVGDTSSRDASGFLDKFSSDGSGLIYSVRLANPLNSATRGVAVDPNGNAYITGLTSNARMPIIGGTQQYLGGDAYLVSDDGGESFTARRTGLRAAQTTVIAFDLNVEGLVYAGTLQGVFRSVDGGNTWTPAGLDDLSIAAIAVDPAHAGTLYAGTKSGAGLYRSSDGGDTWTAITNGASRVSVSAIAVDPTGSGTLYVVTGSNGSGINIGQPVFRITDDGDTWAPIGQGLSSTMQSLAVNPVDAMLFGGTMRFTWVNQIFGGIFVIPGTVFRREGDAWVDGGLNDDIRALAFHDGTLYAAGQKFYQSTDDGRTWASTALPCPALASQIAADSSRIYALCGSAPTTLVRSDDAGGSFRSVNKGNFSGFAVNPFDSSLHVGTAASADAFLAEFDPAGTLIYSNFIGNANAERGEGVALDAAGTPYVIGFGGPGNFALPYTGRAFVARADGSYSVDLGASTSATVIDTPSHGIAIAPDGSIVAVMIATAPGLATDNAAQGNLHGTSDVYVVKFAPR